MSLSGERSLSEDDKKREGSTIIFVPGMSVPKAQHPPFWLDLQLSDFVLLFLGVVLSASARWLQSTLRQKRKLHSTYKLWIDRARHERDAKTHKALDQSSENNEFLNADEIHKKCLEGSLDPVKQTIFAAKRCRTYGRLVANAIAEEFYDEAVEIATALKSVREQSSSCPLYGIPVSVKECIALKGSYSTAGLACRLKNRDKDDSVIVKTILSAGAIPVCSGNVIQMMMLPEANNRIWGRSLNPWDLRRTPGGSSGGDAALVAMKCVPLAVCSDVAGSIRIPASFCGVVGFKPTASRVSSRGSMRPRKLDRVGTSPIIPAVIGPIATNVGGCALFMKAVSGPDMHKMDPNTPWIPFNDHAYQSKGQLRIGYFLSDNWFEPCPTSCRAVLDTVAKLEAVGHSCVPFDLPTDGWYNYSLLVAINTADDLKSFKEGLEGESFVEEYNPIIKANALPGWVRSVLTKVTPKRISALLSQSTKGGVSVYEHWQKSAQVAEVREKWTKAFLEAKLDAIVFPAMPLPALKHGTSGELTSCCSYMFIANLLQWPAGCVPVTTVRKQEARYFTKDELPENQRDPIAHKACKTMEGSSGLPMSVQVMTPAYEDEKCLRLMKEIEDIASFRDEPTAYRRETI